MNGVFSVTIPLPDTATGWQGNNVTGHIFRAPSTDFGGVTLVGASYVDGASGGAGTAFSLQIENWGTAGTAIKSGAAGTVAAALGGTGDPFLASTPKNFTLSKPILGGGEWLVLRKAETNSSDPTRGVLVLQYVMGE